MRRAKICALVIGSWCLFAAGCGTQKDLAETANGITLFHAEMNNQDYSAIYNEADQRFRDATKREDFFAFMNGVHRKLGYEQSCERRTFNVYFNTSGTQVRVSYATKFSQGDAQEQFTWVRNGDGMKLLGYNINSTALIIR